MERVSRQSVVLTWGSGSRTGHRHPGFTAGDEWGYRDGGMNGSSPFDQNGDTLRPSYCADLSRHGVNFVGETAEVGSVALARGVSLRTCGGAG